MEAQKTAVEAKNEYDLRVPCFCEENVYRLAYRLIHKETNQEGVQYHVVFVSNPKKCVPMFQQLAVENPLEPCFWDYHVILFQSKNNTTEVLDIDSHLPCRIPLKDYLENVFPASQEWRREYYPYFRVVEANHFLEIFSSNRMHMYNTETKQWSAPPPPYECIQRTNENNVEFFFTITKAEIISKTQVSENQGFGAILSLVQLQKRFHVN